MVLPVRAGHQPQPAVFRAETVQVKKDPDKPGPCPVLVSPRCLAAAAWVRVGVEAVLRAACESAAHQRKSDSPSGDANQITAQLFFLLLTT